MAEKKEEIYHILSLPLIARTELSDEQQKLAYKYFDKYGYKSFNPENIKTVSDKFTSPILCTFLYLVFKLLLLNEHEAGIKIYKQDNPKFESSMATLKQIHTPIVNEILSEVKYCESKNISKLFVDLLNDIYKNRDNGHVFGGYGGMGPAKLTDSREKEFATTEPNKENKKKNENYVRRTLVRPDEDYVSYNKNNSALVLLDSIDYNYLGHIYIWPSMDYNETCDVIGIRTSIVNLLCQKTKKIGIKIIASAILWAHENKFKLLRIQQPLDIMATIAQKLGFWKSRFQDYWILVEPNYERISKFAFDKYDFINYNCNYPWFEKGADLSDKEIDFLLNKIDKDINEKFKYELTKDDISLLKKYLKDNNKWKPYYYWPGNILNVISGLVEKKFESYYEFPEEITEILEKIVKREY